MANFLEILNAVTTGLGGLATIANQAAERKRAEDLQMLQFLEKSGLASIEPVAPEETRRSGILSAIAGSPFAPSTGGYPTVRVGSGTYTAKPYKQLTEEDLAGLLSIIQPQTSQTPQQQSTLQAPQAAPAFFATTPSPAPSVAIPSAAATVPGTPIAQATRSATSYLPLVRRISKEEGVDPNIAFAILQSESGGDARAESKKGAQGLMQLMPDTQKRFAVTDPFIPEQNIRGGIRYIKELQQLFPNNLRHVIAAYNAGEGRVQEYKGIPPFPETQRFVERVIARLPVQTPQAAVQVASADERFAPLAQEGKTPALQMTAQLQQPSPVLQSVAPSGPQKATQGQSARQQLLAARMKLLLAQPGPPRQKLEKLGTLLDSAAKLEQEDRNRVQSSAASLAASFKFPGFLEAQSFDDIRRIAKSLPQAQRVDALMLAGLERVDLAKQFGPDAARAILAIESGKLAEAGATTPTIQSFQDATGLSIDIAAEKEKRTTEARKAAEMISGDVLADLMPQYERFRGKKVPPQVLATLSEGLLREAMVHALDQKYPAIGGSAPSSPTNQGGTTPSPTAVTTAQPSPLEGATPARIHLAREWLNQGLIKPDKATDIVAGTLQDQDKDTAELRKPISRIDPERAARYYDVATRQPISHMTPLWDVLTNSNIVLLTNQQQERMSMISELLPTTHLIADQIEAMYSKEGPLSGGRVGANIRSFYESYSQNFAEFNTLVDKLEGLVERFGRSFTGAVGVQTERDVTRFRALLPQVRLSLANMLKQGGMDTKEVAFTRVNELFEIAQRNMDAILRITPVNVGRRLQTGTGRSTLEETEQLLKAPAKR